MKNKEVWLTYEYLRTYGISTNTIDSWGKRGLIIKNKEYGNSSILYDTIPATTRAKLPSKEEIIKSFEDKKDTDTVTAFYMELMKAQKEEFAKYREIYVAKVPFAKVLEYAQKHAVLEEVLTIRQEYQDDGTRFPLRYVWEAFCKLYPDCYTYNYFAHGLTSCEMNGIDDFLIKKAVSVKQFDARYDKMVLDCLSSKKRYNQPQIHNKIRQVCEIKGWRVPSLGWVKLKCNELSTITIDRDGNEAALYHQKPYMGLKQAQNANTQWQIDGWRLPFYMKGFKTLSLFSVIDSFSSKMIGTFVSESENTETILKGLEDAVKNTGVLPFEIVSDNHSFNQTKEAEFLKEQLSLIGTTWTVTQNPRRKSRVERSFKTFGEDFCKDLYGYIGQGIKSREKCAKPAQEMIDKAVKNPLTKEQIILIAGRCVYEWNNTMMKDGKTRGEKYDEAVNNPANDKKSFTVAPLEQIRIFIRRSEVTVRRGQISIERGGIRYEYQVTAKDFSRLNGKKVGIRYNTMDEIMVYDQKTDNFICVLKQKEYAYAALGDQSPKDVELFNKHSGRLRGIDNQARKQQERIYNEAVSIDPEAAYVMNPLLTPKSDFEEYKRNGVLMDFADRHGIRPDDVPSIKVECEKAAYEPENKRLRERSNPYHTEKELDLSRFDL